MTVRYRPAALDDLDKIFDHTVAKWGLPQAEVYHAQIPATVAQLIRHPRSGHVYRCLSDLLEFRSIPSGRHLVFYLLEGNTIEIVRILHERMDIRGKELDD